MIKFFREIRKNLLSEGKTVNYLKYAIGEIVLVVIGILIAIQLNNWKQSSIESGLEKKYLINLVTELEQDSIGLTENYRQLQNQAKIKNHFLDLINKEIKHDSIIYYFEYQWRPIQPKTAIKSTYSEMINNSHLKIIKNDTLRKKIINFYNAYEILEKEEDFFIQSSTKTILNLISQSIPNITNYDIDDVMSLKSNNHLLNAIQLNGAFTRRNNYKKIINKCSELTRDIKKLQAEQN
ncbi:hypothetical protein [uncultured Lacinutrix sp.]|uniref:hypothetical protein n=1 Tax=uncultured Lacinutrix sp. TaxID=574032 RepID=UPI00260FCEBB|nr:hypothetical protein [uncultured Lacinutrix sp.]